MYILALDGGGAAGYITVKLLEKLEQESGDRCFRLFDLIAGVSTGSIIGACLAQGMPASELAKLYKEIIVKVFPLRSSNWFKQKFYTIKDMFSAKYSLDPVEKALKEVFGANSEKTNFQTRFMCHTARVTTSLDTVFWKSWNTNNAFPLVDAVLNSSCAPTFFKPRLGADGNVYVDGAISSNSTTMCSIAEAVKLGFNLDTLYVVNMQTGDTPALPVKKARKFGGQLSWVSDIAGLIISNGSEIDEYQAHQLIGFRNHVLVPDYFPGLDSQDFAGMEKLADKMWAKHQKALLERLTLS